MALPLLPLIGAAGGTIQGVSSLIGGGKARRAAKKSRKAELAQLRASLGRFDEQSPRHLLALQEGQQGMEGGLAQEREGNARKEIAFQRQRMMDAIKQAKRGHKAASRQERLEVFGDAAGTIGNMAAGLGELYRTPAMNSTDQLGATLGAGVAPMFGPWAMPGMINQGINLSRKRQMGMLRNGY